MSPADAIDALLDALDDFETAVLEPETRPRLPYNLERSFDHLRRAVRMLAREYSRMLAREYSRKVGT